MLFTNNIILIDEKLVIIETCLIWCTISTFVTGLYSFTFLFVSYLKMVFSNMAYLVTSMYYYIMINILDPLCFSGLVVLDCCRMLRSVLLSYEHHCFLTILVDEHMIIVMKFHHYKTFTTMTLILLFLYLRHCV